MLVLYIDFQAKIVFNLKLFSSHFEKVLTDTTSCNSLFTIIIGYFTARSSVWWTKHKTTIEEIQLKFLN